MSLSHLKIECKNINYDPYIEYKNNFEKIMDWNVELESIKFLEINTGENVCNQGLGNIFLEHEKTKPF